MRGNPRSSAASAITHRSIPACAGEPILGRHTERCRRVYPRVCGGTRVPSGDCCCVFGLSPRVRGNHLVGMPGQGAGGSIPACAGEPRSLRKLVHENEVYPRVCGGTLFLGSPQPAPRGLSPRVRGNLLVDLHDVYLDGSIPACAGEPRMDIPRGGAARVYPRVCGGTLPAGAGSPCEQGLSPRVRGNQQGLMGFNVPSDGFQCPDWVYPRVCGGTAMRCERDRRRRGLSPRVRGNRIV